jgi:hypothetical protein
VTVPRLELHRLFHHWSCGKEGENKTIGITAKESKKKEQREAIHSVQGHNGALED